MKQISNKKYEMYQQYEKDKLYGRILSPNGLRVICAGLDNDPMKIGIHMLEMVEKFRREGLYDVIVDDEEEEETVDGSLS
ncbi:MAG: cytochrome C [Lachnospiraceae bacterium]|nr:cytochrome C [Lachnospiraceae bacterium]